MKSLLGIFSFIFIYLKFSAANASECTQTGNYLRNGIGYEYKYIGEAVASAVGTTDRVAGIKQECQVLVHPTGSCRFLLKVKSCQLFDIPSPGNQKRLYQEHSFSPDFNKLMTDNPLEFYMSDGDIVNIKHASDELLWVLNIKRGIVSSFLVSKSESRQNGEWQQHTDVQGTCPQKVTKDPEDGTKINTVKDMFYCHVPQRKYHELSPWSLFNNMSFIQNLINSSMSCDYIVNEEGIKKMVCNERHAILLESTHRTTTAVQTNILKSLTLSRTTQMQNSVEAKKVSVESSILYEYEAPTTKPPNPTYFRTKAFKMMTDLVQTTNEETRLFTITMFTDFLKHIRNSPDLVRLVQDIKGCKFMTRCNKFEKERALAFLQDALVQCSTAACAQGFRIILKDVTTLYFNSAVWTWSNGYVTDPKFADEVLKMCKEKDTRSCWFALGTILDTLSGRYEKEIYRQFPDSVYNTVKYFVDEMNADCSPAKKGNKGQLNHILTMMKSLVNVGPKLFRISPDIGSKVVKCLKNKDVPADIVVAATELAGLGPKIAGVTDRLWNIVKNEDLDVQVRVEAYLAMANNDGSDDTAQKIVDLLSTIESKQVKNFIVSHIRKLVRNDFRDYPRLTRFDPIFYEEGPRPIGNKQLSDSLMVVFEDPKYEGLLDEVKNYHGTYSSIDAGNFMHFFELDSWNKYRNSFGYIADDMTLYQTDSSRPRFVSTNHTVELFNKVMNYFEVGATAKDIFSIHGKDPNQSNYDYILEIMQGLLYTKNKKWNPNIFSSKDTSGTIKSILDNIKNMHAKFAKQMKADPHFMSYLKVVGKYVTMVTLADIQEGSMEVQRQVGALPFMMQKLGVGMNRDNHRNIKVVEAFHQFPTSVGLPLNWTTDATLSFSIRSSLQLDMQKKKVEAHFKPSGALTFINSMFIVLPTVIDAGIQSNSSAYTSTQWHLTAQMLSSEKVKISLKAPNKPQEVLNLFRNNYIIHGGKPELLADYNIQRVSKSWCQEGLFKKLTGVKACRQKSYANVTNLVKPWFPMAGSAKWRLVLYKADQNLKSYDLTLAQDKKSKDAFTVKVDFQAAGSYTKRTVNSVLKIGRSIDFKTTLPESPKFVLQFKHANFNAKYETTLTMKDTTGDPYEISFKSDLINQRIKATKGINSSPKDIYENVAIHDKVFQFTLPEEIYSWTYKQQKKKATYGLDANMLFKYELTKGAKSWLHPVLPDIFWEADKKSSWVLFKAKVDSPVTVAFGGRKVTGLFHLNVPKTDLEVETERINSELKNSMAIKAKKIEVLSKKLMSFADITLSQKIDVSSPKMRTTAINFNLTVPRHSIAFDSTVESHFNQDVKIYSALSFAKMVPKAKSDWFHIGWWHKDTQDRFEHNSWTVQLDLDATNLASQWPVISKIDGTTDLTAPYGGHSFKKGKIDWSYFVDASLTYPHGSKENVINIKGHSIIDNTEMKGLSLLRQVQLTSKLHESTFNWKYYFGKNAEDVKFHGQVFHYEANSKLYGKYLISLDHKVNPWNMQLSHSLVSRHFTFSSTIVSPEPSPKDLIITIDTSSDIWKSLDFKLYQYFSFGKTGWETMNCSDSLSSMNVVANWTDPWYKTYLKTVDYHSKTKLTPSMKLEITHKDVKEYEAILHFLDTGNSLKFTRTTPSDMKSTDFNLYYLEDNVEKQMGWTHLRILSSHVVVGNVTYDMGPFRSLLKKMGSRYQLVKENWNKIKDDPNHDMNKLIATMVPQKTIFKYFENRKKTTKALAKSIKENAYDFVKTWDVFYEPSFQIPVNAWKLLKVKMGQLSLELKSTTYSGWAWHYFDVPGKLTSPAFKKILKTEVRKLLSQSLVIPKKTGFMFMIVHPFHWLKFNKPPQVTPELKDFFVGGGAEKSSPKHKDYQTAVIYGDGEVYTFDEMTYRFSGYPVDGCAYVLASDLIYGAFSILKSKDSITLVMVNTFYRINDKNEVFVNDATSPSSLPLDISPKDTDKKMYISGMENILEINTDVGLYIICDSVDKLCTIKLDQKFRGRTAGLLGDFDGESYNDFKMSSGKVTKDLYAFISSYEMSGKKGCKDTSIMKRYTEKCNSRNEKRISTCNNLFDHKSISSPNYYCFDKVYADPFLQACKKRTSCSEFSSCQFQSAYRAACYNQGIKMTACQECEIDQQGAKSSTRKVQITLLVDQNSDMFGSDSSATGLKSLLDRLDRTFKNKKGYSLRSYSLITFGHPENSAFEGPQVHLASNEVWHSAQTMEKTLFKNLDFKGKSRTEPMKAIEFAAKHLKFDQEASKVFIVVTVDDTLGSRDVRENLKSLERKGISLYSVADFPSVYKGKHVYGVRGDGYVFPHPEKAKKEDREVLFVTVPNGPLSKLTSALDGAVFHRVFLEKNNNKAYYKELANEISTKVFKEVNSKILCHCSPDAWWGFKVNCQSAKQG